MEKRGFVDQKTAARFDAIRALILARRQDFCRQGSVVACWRTYRGRRLGPFFVLRYRDAGRQRTMYLGRSAALAERVKELFAMLQQPRQLARYRRQAQRALRRCKAAWRQELAAAGLTLKGYEIRGWRGLLPARGSESDVFLADKEER